MWTCCTNNLQRKQQLEERHLSRSVASRMGGLQCTHYLYTHRAWVCCRGPGPSWLFYIESNTHTPPFNGPFSGTTRVSRYQKGKTDLDFTEARDSKWQWHQLGHVQVCTSLQTDNHASTPPLSFLQAGCPSCCPTNRVKALKGFI